MGTYPLTFGTYVFPSPATVHVSKFTGARRVPTVKTPLYDGGRALQGLLDLKRFSVQGTLFRPLGNTGANYLRGLLDSLHAGLAQGPAQFSIDTDRYWRLCQAEAYTDDFDPTSYRNYANVAFEVVTGDPFAYSVTGGTVTATLASSGDTASATAGGNAPAAPRISITINSSAALSATVTNNTTGEVFTLNGAVVSGNIIVIDSLLQTVTIAGADRMDLFDGVFPRLAVGSNTLEFQWTTGSMDSVTVAWNDRWY